VRGRIRKEKRTRRTEASTGEMGGEREKSDERGQRGREKWRKEGEKKGDGSRGHGWGNELARRVSIAVEWGKGARGAVGLEGVVPTLRTGGQGVPGDRADPRDPGDAHGEGPTWESAPRRASGDRWEVGHSGPKGRGGWGNAGVPDLESSFVTSAKMD